MPQASSDRLPGAIFGTGYNSICHQVLASKICRAKDAISGPSLWLDEHHEEGHQALYWIQLYWIRT